MSVPQTQSDDISATKAGLRERALARREAIGDAARKQAAERAVENFFRDVPVELGQTISAYWPMRGEIDVKPLLSRLMDEGWRVCLPVVMGEDEPLAFRRWEEGAPLYPAGFGMLEPGDDAPEAVPEIVVMPLLGFDRTGTRLGYGGAYYDRTLATIEPRPLLVGYAFAAQEFDTIPRAEHDIALDLVVTETGVVRFAATAG